MEQLIPIASKLQDVLGAVGQSTTLDLPQIVVVGGQSSGKSSVLEGLVGRSFLPRGHGIVTRRPLVLQLYNTRAPPSVDDDDDDDEDADVDGGVPQEDEFDLTADENHHQQENIDPTNAAAAAAGKNRRANTSTSTTTAGDEWGEFLHLPGRKFYSFSSIRQEIVKETDRLTGTNKGINPTPINLKIYSPHVLALTMVDLPGMAKVPIGDQPDNIEEQIHQMSLQYISNPNAIILAVTSANTDLANSDALKLACAADPRGERTIGVLTKLDLMDPGTDASDILLNKVIPLRHGYIAVVNRGQIDINADVSIRDGLKKEDAFFRNHPVYSRNRGLLIKCGTRHLAKTLNTMLMHHIRDCLPELKNRISHMMADVQLELEALGTPSMNSSRSSLGGSLLNLLSKFATNFASVLDGRGVGETNSATSSSSTRSGHKVHELFGGARVSYIFTEIFATSLLCVRAFDGLSDEEIRMTICNANGTRPALFVPEISFDILSRRQIARLEQPGIQCVDLVYEELQRIASQSEPTELTRFPVLRERMVEVVSALLKRCVGPTQMMVSNLIKIELAYINTSHPDFIGGSRAVANLLEKISKEGDTRRTLPVSAVESGPMTGATNAAMGGATPLSSSSLSNYYNADAAPASPPGLHTPYDTAGTGGIMNFIFRGGKQVRADSTRRGFHDPDNNNGPPSIVHLPQVPDAMRQSDVPPTERERVEMEVIKALIESYFGIVRKNFIDMVPKSIMYFLVNHVRDAMQNELVSELYRDAEIGTLMQEAEDIAQRRHTCMEMKDLLGKALEIVNEVRDYNTFK